MEQPGSAGRQAEHLLVRLLRLPFVVLGALWSFFTDFLRELGSIGDFDDGLDNDSHDDFHDGFDDDFDNDFDNDEWLDALDDDD